MCALNINLTALYFPFQWCPSKTSVFASGAEDGNLNIWDYEKVGVDKRNNTMNNFRDKTRTKRMTRSIFIRCLFMTSRWAMLEQDLQIVPRAYSFSMLDTGLKFIIDCIFIHDK